MKKESWKSDNSCWKS